MSFFLMLARWWDSHGTGILGTATTIVASLIATPGVIAPGHARFWAIANIVLGALTVRRSNENRKKLADAMSPQAEGS